MTPRVFVEPPCGDAVTLDSRQSHHLIRVLRIRAGAKVELFDGSGRVWNAAVSRASRDACRIERGALIAEEAPPEFEIHLAPALLKSDAMDRLLRQATELGVHRLSPLETARTGMARKRALGRYEHWRRILVGASEQSRRAFLPRLNEVRHFDEFIGTLDCRQTLLLHPGARSLQRQLPVESTTVLVGPEGGWTDEELARAADRGIEAYSIGSGILRAETAPLAAIAAIRHAWGWR